MMNIAVMFQNGRLENIFRNIKASYQVAKEWRKE